MSTAEPETVVSCRRVTKQFGSITALDGLDLDVARGRVVGYLGPNGAGKSTTIRMLLDLARPDSGDVRVFAADPRWAGPELRRRIGYLPGELRLDDRLSVAETLGDWSRLRGGVDQRFVDELCARLDLDPSRRSKSLSSGNRRKVGLVGAFMSRPELLILDEPTSGIDPLVQAEFESLVAEATAEGRTVFLSSHVLSEVERLADDIVVIRAGKVVASGPLDELRRSARQPFTVWFAEPAPEEELRRVVGLADLRVHGREVSGTVAGDVNGLLAVLHVHPVERLLLPEPDLEEAFLHLYSGEEERE